MTNESFNPETYFVEIGAWPRRSLKGAYVIGFVLSLLLTFGAYALAAASFLTRDALFISLAVFALAQFIVQLVCFLHLGKEAAARERVVVLAFALLIVGILVSGSLWIMFSLDGRMMPTTDQMMQFMNSQSGL